MAKKRQKNIINCDEVYRKLGLSPFDYPLEEGQKKTIAKACRGFLRSNHPDHGGDKAEYQKTKDQLEYCSMKKPIAANQELIFNGIKISAMDFSDEQDSKSTDTYYSQAEKILCSLVGDLLCNDN